MMMLSVRLSRMASATPTSIATTSATDAHTGRRYARKNPPTQNRMSQIELRTLSP
jgi:hypothetical protein